MKRAAALLFFACFTPLSAQAEQFENCTKTERGQFIAAAERAERLALTATTGIGPNPAFTGWFGPYSAKSGEVVRRKLKSVVAVLRSDEMTATCHNTGQDTCDGSVFAFIYTDAPFRVNLCPGFFRMDTMKQLTEDTTRRGHGTRAGTLIHEISHFTEAAGTEDHCYSRSDCTEMARGNPQAALENADSYQYFAEDVTFFGISGANAQ